MEIDILTDGASSCFFWVEFLFNIYNGKYGRILMILFKISGIIFDCITVYAFSSTDVNLAMWYTICILLDRVPMLFVIPLYALKPPPYYFEYIKYLTSKHHDNDKPEQEKEDTETHTETATNNSHNNANTSHINTVINQTGQTDTNISIPAETNECTSNKENEPKQLGSEQSKINDYNIYTLYIGLLFSFQEWVIKIRGCYYAYTANAMKDLSSQLRKDLIDKETQIALNNSVQSNKTDEERILEHIYGQTWTNGCWSCFYKRVLWLLFTMVVIYSYFTRIAVFAQITITSDAALFDTIVIMMSIITEIVSWPSPWIGLLAAFWRALSVDPANKRIKYIFSAIFIVPVIAYEAVLFDAFIRILRRSLQ